MKLPALGTTFGPLASSTGSGERGRFGVLNNDVDAIGVDVEAVDVDVEAVGVDIGATASVV